jgi:hypothetical protein
MQISLLGSLLKGANLEVEYRHDNNSVLMESRRRLFWSFHVLQQLYGQLDMTVSLIGDVQSPKYNYSVAGVKAGKKVVPPLMPKEFAMNQRVYTTHGIWMYTVQIFSLWNEVRKHVALWRDGEGEVAPWSTSSGYAAINSHLMDIETEYPSIHRYDAAKFWERSSEELEQHRDYWGPWLAIQFTYHAIHSLLNHPFLYSSRTHQTVESSLPNTFWKTLSETALTHTSWTVRLLDLAVDKNFRIFDPFLGHCVAIAATVHLYYCSIEDSGVRRAVQQRLAKCMGFLWKLATIWPVCRTMVSEKLDPGTTDGRTLLFWLTFPA